MNESAQLLESIRAIIQQDVNHRGLATDPGNNLISTCSSDFAKAAQSLAQSQNACVGILTGFFIPHAQPPCAETDGPPGAVFLARAFVALGLRILIYTDAFCLNAFKAGLTAVSLEDLVLVREVSKELTPSQAADQIAADGLTHLIALERVGPSHDLPSIQRQAGDDASWMESFDSEVPLAERDRLRNMRGHDITHLMAPGHLLVEAANASPRAVVTIGIGDGGNEIGMGKIPWPIIRRNIARGALIACRIPTTYLIVAGISNWGAQGLAFAVAMLRQKTVARDLLSEETEQRLLQIMVEQGPLVDGVTGSQTNSVDGLPFDRYAGPLRAFQALANDNL